MPVKLRRESFGGEDFCHINIHHITHRKINMSPRTTGPLRKGNPTFFLRGKNCWFSLDFPFPETNIAPKNGWLEYYFPIREAYFQGLC